MTSTNEYLRPFPHRMNRDGTIDSICPRCYQTIGSATWEADLERMEQAHVCRPESQNHFDAVRELAAKSVGSERSEQVTPAKRAGSSSAH